MKSYYRIMLGKRSKYATEAQAGNFIGAGWLPDIDLTNKIADNWRNFNSQYIPVYLVEYPGKTKISAGLACGMLHTIAKGMTIGDVVLCPDGKGNYLIGEVIGNYTYQKGNILPHRRAVKWSPRTITRTEMSDALRNSTGAIGTLSLNNS